MVTRADSQFTVFFRPDVSEARDEVVVELGKMNGPSPAHVTTPHHWSVTKNGALLFALDVPYRWWWVPLAMAVGAAAGQR
jgi:hypothetical protein